MLICGIIIFGPFDDIVGQTVGLEAKPNSEPFGRSRGQTVSLEAKPNKLLQD